jgi:peptide/nickel transport system permease protein
VAQHLVLPATAMTLTLLGQYFVIMRSSMVDVLTEDFITVKRAIGLPWDRVVRQHAVPNALLPLVTLSAIQFGAVVGGAITIETIFSWPGLGELTFEAINDKDFPVLQGAFLVFSAGVILANLLADCLYFTLDPRVQAR